MHKFLLLASLSLSVACQQSNETAPAEEPAADVAAIDSAMNIGSDTSLAGVLNAQPDEAKARYQFRNPQETIEFFGIEPGMTVLEGLPGGGWYSKILLPYLGEEGRLIGASYALDMWQLFPFASEDFMATRHGWREKFVADAAEWGGGAGARAEALHFGSMPEQYANSVDVAFFPRVLHNAAGFENAGSGDFHTQILSDIFTALKPGGILGIVQHEARPSMSDEFADGSHGYLKQSWLTEQAEAAGFEFVAASDINANPKDQPGEEDIVWRLPPSYVGTRDDADMKAAVDAIGESNRMTLKFRKP